jgi:flagellar biosynthesis/type III secretory pathway M-ring protein FliF/YscJ
MNILAVVMIVGVAVSCTIAYLLMFDERTKQELPDQQSIIKRVLESRTTTLSNVARQPTVPSVPVADGQTKPQEAVSTGAAGSSGSSTVRHGAVEIDEKNIAVLKARDNARAMADVQPERVVAILRRWLSEDDRKFR